MFYMLNIPFYLFVFQTFSVSISFCLEVDGKHLPSHLGEAWSHTHTHPHGLYYLHLVVFPQICWSSLRSFWQLRLRWRNREECVYFVYVCMHRRGVLSARCIALRSVLTLFLPQNREKQCFMLSYGYNHYHQHILKLCFPGTQMYRWCLSWLPIFQYMFVLYVRSRLCGGGAAWQRQTEPEGVHPKNFVPGESTGQSCDNL